MFRRTSLVLLIVAVALAGGCRKNKTVNPIAQLDSKQPDKVLFDRAMADIQRNKFDQARITLQTMINTYPDSEYIARAMLAVGDSWYAENTSAALQQAESEYKNFQTFFPNMPEAAEAQLKVAGIHYRQMEKPDRDYTHAKRAEDEYRQLIQQYPDSKLVPDAKEKLLQVQEVLAEREFRIGRFYFVRQSYPASIARLRSLSDSYPQYSQADEVLYILGQAYEAELNNIRKTNFAEVAKANVLNDLTNRAADSYAKIITRYPAMERADDAKARLKALNRPIPAPTPEALAQNKAEEASRGHTGRMGTIMGNLHKRPDMAQAVKGVEPMMEDAKPTNAQEVMKQVSDAASKSIDGKAATGEIIKPSASKQSDPVPRSDAGSAPPPNQVNEVTAGGDSAKSDAAANSGSSSSSTAQKDSKDSKDSKGAKDQESSSKQKKKKGIRN